MLWKMDPTSTSLLEVMISKTNHINLQDNIETVIPWTTYCLPVQYCTKISKVICISCQRLLSTYTCIARWRLGTQSFQGLPLLAASPQTEYCPHGQPNGVTQPLAPTKKGYKTKQAPVTLGNISKEQQGGEGRGEEEKLEKRNLVVGKNSAQKKNSTCH